MQRSGNILQDNVVVREDGKRKDKISIAARFTPLESREQLSPACVTAGSMPKGRWLGCRAPQDIHQS